MFVQAAKFVQAHASSNGNGKKAKVSPTVHREISIYGQESNYTTWRLALMNDDEIAFYDALADNASAKEVLGDDKLRFLAQELVERVKQSVTIDWQVRENARAQIRVLVKRLLRKFGYPPDMQQRAISNRPRCCARTGLIRRKIMEIGSRMRRNELYQR